MQHSQGDNKQKVNKRNIRRGKKFKGYGSHKNYKSAHNANIEAQTESQYTN